MSINYWSYVNNIPFSGQGIGRAIALRLADDGFDVAVNDIPSSVDKLEAVAEEIKTKGRKSSTHYADVSVERQVKDMIEAVVKEHGGLDVVSSKKIRKFWIADLIFTLGSR